MSSEYTDTSDNSNSQIQAPTGLRMSRVIAWLLYAWSMFGVGILTLRVFLLATSANLEAGFSSFIIRTSYDYMQPFRGIFQSPKVGDNGYFDVSAVFAAIAYLFLGWAFMSLVNYLQAKIDRNVQQQRYEQMRKSVSKSGVNLDSVEIKARRSASQPSRNRRTVN